MKSGGCWERALCVCFSIVALWQSWGDGIGSLPSSQPAKKENMVIGVLRYTRKWKKTEAHEALFVLWSSSLSINSTSDFGVVYTAPLNITAPLLKLHR